MANSGRIAPRDFPPYFRHPSANEQLTAETFEGIPTREMEQHESIGAGHILTKVHLAQAPAERRFIVEVMLQKGRYFIESLCTYTPSMGIDILDGNLIHDAEEWILIQELKMKPRRLRVIFGVHDRLPAAEYIRIITGPHAGSLFQDVPVEFETSLTAERTASAGKTSDKDSKEKWWKFW